MLNITKITTAIKQRVHWWTARQNNKLQRCQSIYTICFNHHLTHISKCLTIQQKKPQDSHKVKLAIICHQHTYTHLIEAHTNQKIYKRRCSLLLHHENLSVTWISFNSSEKLSLLQRTMQCFPSTRLIRVSLSVGFGSWASTLVFSPQEQISCILLIANNCIDLKNPKSWENYKKICWLEDL